MGMPANKVSDPEMRDLLAFLRTLKQQRGLRPVRGKVQTTDGKTLEGLILNQTSWDMQLRTDDERVHLLRKTGDVYRVVTSDAEWPTYNGDIGGNRYTPLKQIDKSNVQRLAPKWTFTLPNVSSPPNHPCCGGRHHVCHKREPMLRAGCGRREADMAL